MDDVFCKALFLKTYFLAERQWGWSPCIDRRMVGWGH